MAIRILIIQGHPVTLSFIFALHAAYKKGALSAGAEVQEKIKWCEHVVLIYPVWSGAMPAVLKGFFDRVFFARVCV